MICKKLNGIIIAFALILTCIGGKAQISGQSARQSSMARTYTTIDGFWALHGNPAGLTSLKNSALGFTLENRFLTKELNRQWFGIAFPYQENIWGISASRFGNSLFNRQEISGAYARKFGKRFSAGLKFDYHRIALAENYGSSSAFTFDAGILGSLSEHFTIGVHVYNPVQAKYSSEQTETIPSGIATGIKYKADDHFFLSAEVEKTNEYEASIKGAFSYELTKTMSFCGGYATQPETFAFGVNLNWQSFEFDFGSSWHRYLGYSPSFSLIWQIQ